MTDQNHWYRNAIIYGLDVETFYDGNGDGVGDFVGLAEKLDYFLDLGVTVLWLLPFFPTPDRDNGYDVKDYLEVDPRLGSLDDFVTFARKAKERGLRIMVDVVVNHTSTDHPWFRAARLDRASRYRDYYIWTNDPPPTPSGEGSIFQGQEQTIWTYDEEAGAYYYHRFYHHEPSLNPTNPHVLDEIEAIVDYWVSLGADAVRMDAVSHMIDGSPLPQTQPEAPQAILRNLRSFLDERSPHVALMGEADEPAAELDRYFGEGDQLHMLMNFLLNNYLFLSFARRTAAPIRTALDLLPAIPPSCAWANFLRNLDEVDLERLEPEEMQEVLEAFAPEDGMRIFGRGIRRRLAPILDGNPDRILLAFALLLSLPGAPLIVYGDEIGMGENLDLPGREAVRTPMQWTSGRNGGFSEANEEDVVRHSIDTGPFSFEKVNVEDQRGDGGSLFCGVRQLLHARRATPEIGTGELEILRTEQEDVLVHGLQHHNDRFVGLHNLSDEQQEVSFEIPSRGEFTFRKVADSDSQAPEELEMPVALGAFGFAWYRAAPGEA